jgi:AAHS family 4-hydroxybenzoate transporter-like MFS transporter
MRAGRDTADPQSFDTRRRQSAGAKKQRINKNRESTMAQSDAGAINVLDFIDQHKYSAFQWMTFAICIFIVIMDGFDTAAIGFIAPSLTTEWHIAKADLGPVLSAALFGLAAGALFSGPLADRFGRKKVLLGAVLILGGASLVAAYSGDLTTLTIWRFISGLGLGAAMPNSVTLVSEYAPKPKRSLLTNAMFCGFPVGSALGGFFAAWIIPQFGWRAVLIFGGVVPLVLSLIILVLLPESVRFMAQNHTPTEKIRAVLRRISPDANRARSFFLREPIMASEAFTSGRHGIGLVMSRFLLPGTLCLWTTYFMGLVIVYGLVNWMPILFRDSGISASTAAIIAALFQLGGFGALFSGWLMDRFNANVIIAFCYVLTAALVFFIGRAVGDVGPLATVVFLAGTAMNTAQTSMPTLAAAFYPTRGRATGVSWMLGVGRFGGIAGSFLVAELGRRHFTTEQVFMVMAIPGLIAAGTVLLKKTLYAEDKEIQPEPAAVAH